MKATSRTKVTLTFEQKEQKVNNNKWFKETTLNIGDKVKWKWNKQAIRKQ